MSTIQVADRRSLSGRRAAPAQRAPRGRAFRTKRRLILNTTAFEEVIADSKFAWKSQRSLAEDHLGIDEASWSQMRAGKRYMSDAVVAGVMEMFPDLPLKSFAISVLERTR